MEIKTELILAVALFLFMLFPSIALSGSSENNLVTARIETDAPSYLQGEDVKIRVYVVNQKNMPLMYPTEIGCSVSDSEGRAVGLSCFIYIMWVNPPPTFPPHGKTLFQLGISSEDSTLSWSTRNNAGMKVRIGAYTIKVHLEGPEISLSSEITIKVYPDIDALPRASRWGFTFH